MTAVAACFQEGKPPSYKQQYVNMLEISPYCCAYNLHKCVLITVEAKWVAQVFVFSETIPLTPVC